MTKDFAMFCDHMEKVIEKSIIPIKERMDIQDRERTDIHGKINNLIVDTVVMKNTLVGDNNGTKGFIKETKEDIKELKADMKNNNSKWSKISGGVTFGIALGSFILGITAGSVSLMKVFKII